MYLFEWGYQWIRRNSGTYEEAMAKAAKVKRKPGQAVLEAPENVRESVSAEVYDNDSLYAFNDTYVDMRTPNDEKRGLIALASLGLGGVLVWGFGSLFFLIAMDLLRGRLEDGASFTLEFYVSSLIMVVTGCVSLYLFGKYVGPYMRLELFTARRIIVRFNRVTRRVYLLRPKHCGGVLSADWDKTQIMVDKSMRGTQGAGGFVWLAWDRGGAVDENGEPIEWPECTFVGKTTRNAEELLAFWEYIRRYMEEGPQAVPAPKRLIQKFPWPWNSFKAVWGLDTSFFGDSRLWIFVLLRVMVLPAVILQGLGHWVSLLLCYEPKFPNDIENAGR